MAMTLIPKRKIQNISQVKEIISHITQNVELTFPQDRILTVNDGNPVLELKQTGSGKGLFVNMDGAGVGIEIDSAAPEQQFTENDQTDPAGRYRLIVTGDALYIERADSASWATLRGFLRFFKSATTGRAIVALRTVGDDQTIDVQIGHASYVSDVIPWQSGTSSFQTCWQVKGITNLGVKGETVMSFRNHQSAPYMQMDAVAIPNAGWYKGLNAAGTGVVNLFGIGTDNLGKISELGYIEMGAATELTIAAGSVTQTRMYHTIDTEADAATDNLDTITQAAGHFILIRAANDARDIVVKHGTGNIKLRGAADITLDTTEKALLLIYTGSNWVDL